MRNLVSKAFLRNYSQIKIKAPNLSCFTQDVIVSGTFTINLLASIYKQCAIFRLRNVG